MFSASQLTESQIQALRDCAAKGGNMSDLQKLLKEEHGFSITYMDTRFLILDLGIQLIEEEKEEPVDETPAIQPEPTGSVQVSMDSLALPGALVSGKVTFSDGESAVWMLDQSGRMGLDPDTVGYRPNPEDVTEFQKQLRALLEKGGL